MTGRLLIIALSLVGCATRGIVEPAPRKEIVAKRERLVVRYTDRAYEEYIVDRWWLMAADGTACPVGQGMWSSVYVGQVLACPHRWRTMVEVQ